MNLIKDFFYFTKSKLIVFIVLSISIFYLMAQQDVVLGNFSWSSLIIILLIIYLILNILWFSFIDKKHFIIGLILLVLFALAYFYSADYYSQKREKATNDCMVQVNSKVINIEVVRCLSSKGYKKYR